MKRRLQTLAGVTLVPLVLIACSGDKEDPAPAASATTSAAASETTSAAAGETTSAAAGETTSAAAAPAAEPVKGEIKYGLWDANQQPQYQKCADDFQAKNPEAKITFQQQGWVDYWNAITTGLVSGTAPDVITNHLAKYPEFANKKQILPINEFVERDKVDLSVYVPGLADLWVAPDGNRYGLPKDFDTIALFYNKKMTKEAGITDEQMNTLTWNPKDGGTYEKVIARLTVDQNNKRGDEPGFDKTKVKTYGIWLEVPLGGGSGQAQYSMYTGANGFKYTDKELWGTKYNYDDPKFQEAIGWWKSLIDKGYMPPRKAADGVAWFDQMAAGKAASATNGSWMTNTVFSIKEIEPAVAPTPIGPGGKRASMFNGLADTIYAGTKNKEGAWQWLKHLASPECQKHVADAAVVFPAVESLVEESQANFAKKGVDVSAFTVHIKDKTTFLFPITDHASDIDEIMTAAMDAVMSGEKPVTHLTEANTQVNALFK